MRFPVLPRQEPWALSRQEEGADPLRPCSSVPGQQLLLDTMLRSHVIPLCLSSPASNGLREFT